MSVGCMYSRQKQHHTVLLFAGCERCTEKRIKVVESEACHDWLQVRLADTVDAIPWKGVSGVLPCVATAWRQWGAPVHSDGSPVAPSPLFFGLSALACHASNSPVSPTRMTASVSVSLDSRSSSPTLALHLYFYHAFLLMLWSRCCGRESARERPSKRERRQRAKARASTKGREASVRKPALIISVRLIVNIFALKTCSKHAKTLKLQDIIAATYVGERNSAISCEHDSLGSALCGKSFFKGPWWSGALKQMSEIKWMSR